MAVSRSSALNSWTTASIWVASSSTIKSDALGLDPATKHWMSCPWTWMLMTCGSMMEQPLLLIFLLGLGSPSKRLSAGSAWSCGWSTLALRNLIRFWSVVELDKLAFRPGLLPVRKWMMACEAGLNWSHVLSNFWEIRSLGTRMESSSWYRNSILWMKDTMVAVDCAKITWGVGYYSLKPWPQEHFFLTPKQKHASCKW